MNVSTKLTLIVCSLALTLGGCARTSPDRAPPHAPDDDPSYSEDVPADPVIDSVGNSERLPPTPGSDRPAPETQDIDNPDGRIDQPVDPHQPEDGTGPNPANPGVPPPPSRR